MAAAETARLVASLELQDKFTAPIGKAAASVGTLDQRMASVARRGVSVLQRGFGLASTAAGRFGAALGNAKNRIIGLLTGPLGMLGLGAGLFSLGGLFKSGIDKAREFGGVVSRLAQLTGLSVETTSRLAAAFEHFGIEADSVKAIVGLAEKNLGILTATQKKGAASTEQITKARERLRVASARLNEVEHQRNVKTSTLLAAQNRVADATRTLNALLGKHGKAVSGATDFYKKYGLALTDSSGRAKDFNTLLLDSADFFNNKSIPAQTKAAALAKLYGRGWQDLIPILSAGRKGISDAEDEAIRLGLTLTKDNIVALGKAKAATRLWNDALGGLKLQIGLAVLPALTAFTKSVTTIVVDNRTKIVGFVKGIADGAVTLATAFNTSVLPVLKDVAAIIGTMFSAGGGIGFSAILHESANFAKDLGAAINSFVVPAIRAIVGAWDGLPDDLRSLLIKGFIANKVLKWTFGFDAVGFGVKLASTFVANVAGKLTADVAGSLVSAGIGKAFVQPVFVTNPGFGLPGAGGAPAIPLGPGASGKGPGIVPLIGATSIAAAIVLAAVPIGEAFASVLPDWLKGPGGRGESVPQQAARERAESQSGALDKLVTEAERTTAGTRTAAQQIQDAIATAQRTQQQADAIRQSGSTSAIQRSTISAAEQIKAEVDRAAGKTAGATSATTQAIKDKDLSVTVPVNVAQTTYFNGRIVNANLTRYNSTVNKGHRPE